ASAAREPVDYVALGPVFRTGSKRNPDPLLGVDVLRRCRALIEKPLVAIGGITLENAGEVWKAGADSLAVIGGLLPEEANAQALRVRVSATRYRVPDICVVAGPEPDEQVFTSPPFLCIEVLSPEDRVSRMQQKIDDYLSFGVSCVWVVDPRTRKAWIYTAEGMREVRDGMLRTESPEI